MTCNARPPVVSDTTCNAPDLRRPLPEDNRHG
jgi:hypothetical protein